MGLNEAFISTKLIMDKVDILIVNIVVLINLMEHGAYKHYVTFIWNNKNVVLIVGGMWPFKEME
jgi:hypothetical protein